MESDLRQIPGVGKAVEGDLHGMGIHRVEELVGQDPEELYDRLMLEQGAYVDRCMLYVFRCAVYYAEGGREPEKLRWWNWKDSKKQ
ncbi:helix-hairpin-helix domain-containing protein [Streptomyces sp. PSAA01]|uniref:helix-hairpin-helix domain-containing protein n=1 Tax=Streptomyces sp. PSAA01 TaxID=2912762 RepID=UPI001F3C09B3|nr:helix-hairpin-helix domain-containing protein [Streptomyces sp. PSAA01]MCG0287995.1 helix-hairpin-helix domain-containing protein [Streptomyces sp. PSAA01]